MTTSSAEATIATAPADVNPRLLAWVRKTAERTQPAAIQWCDGSQEEYDRLCQQLGGAGTFARLADAKPPNSSLARSDPRAVARVEDRTFICATSQRQAGPTNNWRDPRLMRAIIT